jgi:hypothetical protein
MRLLLTVTAGFALLICSFAMSASQTAAGDDDIGKTVIAAIFGDGEEQEKANKLLLARGDRDVVAPLLLALRYRGPQGGVGETLRGLTGLATEDWNELMLWQEVHSEVTPHPAYRQAKLTILSQIDPQFMRFLAGERSERQNMRIRLEEIEWGGVAVDGIPSLDNPKMLEASQAEYLGDDNLVFGVSINGDARAYPLRIMGWHEMFNDVIGGVPVALAYCTLCGSGILYETSVAGRDKPFVFGSSGFLYRSNKLMFDRETDSLWNQFTGEPVVGPLSQSGIKLKVLPVTITSWGNWRKANPGTRVLSLETGHRRDYGEGVVYENYFGSPDLMFPAFVSDESVVKKKDYVFGMREFGFQKAWPLAAFEKKKVINDRFADANVVLVGDYATRTVRAYQRGDFEFASTADLSILAGPGGEWKIDEDAISGPGGEKLARLPGHIAYWFAWNNYFGVKSELYRE